MSVNLNRCPWRMVLNVVFNKNPLSLPVVNPSVLVLLMLYVMRLIIGWKRMPVIG